MGPSIYPFLLSLVVGGVFIGFIFTAWMMPIGMALTFIVLFGWFWSNSTGHRAFSHDQIQEEAKEDKKNPPHLKPTEAEG